MDNDRAARLMAMARRGALYTGVLSEKPPQANKVYNIGKM